MESAWLDSANNMKVHSHAVFTGVCTAWVPDDDDGDDDMIRQ